jgi:hypothetical protein
MGRLVFVNSTRLNENNYTLGSGVGGVSGSNRAALKRRAANSYCVETEISTKTRYIKVFFPTSPTGIIQISQIAVYSDGINIALTGTTSSGSTLGDASSKDIPINGVLSVRDFPEIYHSSETMSDRYWLLDLGAEFVVDRIVYYNRVVGYASRAIGMVIDTYNSTYNNSLPNAIAPLKRFTLTDSLIQTFDL